MFLICSLQLLEREDRERMGLNKGREGSKVEKGGNGGQCGEKSGIKEIKMTNKVASASSIFKHAH